MLAVAVVASIVFVVAASHGTHATRASRIDMAKINCQGYLQAVASGKDPGGANLMWMSGYFAGKASDTTFDTDRHIKAGRQLSYLCRSNPRALVIDVYGRALADNSGDL
jgi:hypothetical protein